MSDDYILDGDQFPDRPDHPDFWHLSEIVLQLDGQSDDRPVDQILAELADPLSVLYVGEQRTSRVLDEYESAIALGIPMVNLRALVLAVYMDAFTTGARFQQRYGKDPE